MSPISSFSNIFYRILHSPFFYFAVALLVITIGMIIANKIFHDPDNADKPDKNK